VGPCGIGRLVSEGDRGPPADIIRVRRAYVAGVQWAVIERATIGSAGGGVPASRPYFA